MTPREPQAVINGHETAERAAVRDLHNFIGGAWSRSDSTRHGEVRNPVSDELLARVPLGAASDVDRAVQAALKAYPGWRRTPPVNRVRFMFALKNLMEKRFDDIASTITLEHGKTLDESRSSVRRAIDNVDLAIGIPTRMMGTALEDIASGIDCHTVRQPLRCVRRDHALQPAMVPMWFLPHAVAATGAPAIVGQRARAARRCDLRLMQARDSPTE
jgi:malonate-semialdehyde dehydrogenase (acetylating)/methylmalonate-semialdehyde dehydrogenase